MKDTLRVLHIGKYFFPYAGGMENYLADLMVALAREGVDNRALVHAGSLGLRGGRERITLRGVTLQIARAATWARLLFTPISPGFPLLLRSLLVEQDPQILHIHMPNVSAFWLLLSRRARRAQWIVHWHADVVASPSKSGLRIFYRLYRPFERALLRRAARIVVTSPPYLHSSEPLRDFQERCTVIPLGLDPERLPLPVGIDARADAADRKILRVLAVGRLTYYKGFEYLLQACAACDATELQLVGTGEESERLRQLAQSLGIAGRVRFHGALSDAELVAQYAACDVLCLPSIERTEAFGVVLLEAMHFGKPVVVSDVPGSGMGWVVRDGDTGFVVPMRDSAALAGRLRSLADDRELAARLGAEAQRSFDERFHIDRSASQVLSLYREVLGA